AVDGPNSGQRHGALVPLAGRLPRGPAVAGHGEDVLRLARSPGTALPQHALGDRPGGAVPAEHDRVLPRRAGAGDRLPAGALRGITARALSLRLRARERPVEGNAR